MEDPLRLWGLSHGAGGVEKAQQELGRVSFDVCGTEDFGEMHLDMKYLANRKANHKVLNWKEILSDFCAKFPSLTR